MEISFENLKPLDNIRVYWLKKCGIVLKMLTQQKNKIK